MDPRPSTAWITVLPRKRAERSMPPKADSRAERAVGVVAKAPTAKPPTAPTVAPSTNLLVPSPKIWVLSALSGFDGASLAQRLCSKVRWDAAGYTELRMMETGKRDRLRSLPAVDAVLRDSSGLALADHHGLARATMAVREALDDLRRRKARGVGQGRRRCGLRRARGQGARTGRQCHGREPARHPGAREPLGGG